MSGRRSVSRVRTRRSAATPEISPERRVREINLEEIDPERMLEYLRTTGHLSEANAGPSGSAVPPSGNVDDASTRALSNMEAMFVQQTVGSGNLYGARLSSVNGSYGSYVDGINNREAPSKISRSSHV
jgi:hypothetical protein